MPFGEFATGLGAQAVVALSDAAPSGDVGVEPLVVPPNEKRQRALASSSAFMRRPFV
jgi:hypothetical protein